MAGSANAPTQQTGTYGVQPQGWKDTPTQNTPAGWVNPYAGSGRTWSSATDGEIRGQLSGKNDGSGMINFGHYGPKEIADYRTRNGSNLMDGTGTNSITAPSMSTGSDFLPIAPGTPGASGGWGKFGPMIPEQGPIGPGLAGGISNIDPTMANTRDVATNQPTQGGKGGGNVAQPTPQPAPYIPANTGPTAQQPNINTQSAQGITSAMQGTQAEMGYRPQQVRVPGQSATIGSAGKSTLIGNPGQSGTVGGVNQSSQVQAGQLSGTNYDPYMNPYTDAVIKSAEGDILRGGEKALTGLGSQASAAGAFGGSRHGIAMGEMGRNITEQMAKSSTGLRQANYQQAQQAAQQDIASRMQAGLANQQASQFDIGNVRQQQLANQQASQFDIGNRLKAGQLNQQASQFDIGNVRQAQLANQTAGMQDIQNMMSAQQLNQAAGLSGSQNRLNAAQSLGSLSNLGFGMGQTVQQNLAGQGTQQQAMMQALIDAAKGQYGGYTGHPAQGLGYVTQALGATGTPTNTTQSSDPGLFGYLTAASAIPGLFPSDERLKKNITKMGKLKSGLNIYRWDWREGAEKFGADMNHTIGVIAQEVKEVFPNAVAKMDNGYYAVNYSKLR